MYNLTKKYGQDELRTWASLYSMLKTFSKSWPALPQSAVEARNYKQKFLRILPDILGGVPARGIPDFIVRTSIQEGNGILRQFHLESEPGTKVPLSIYSPKKISGKCPLIILAPMDTFAWGIWRSAIKFLRDEGYIVAVVDIHGANERDLKEDKVNVGTSILQSLCFASGRSWIGLTTWDICKAIDLLEHISEVDTRRMTVIGDGAAGIACLLSAILRPEIQGIVGLFCGVTYKGLADSLTDESVWLPAWFLPCIFQYGDLDNLFAAASPTSLYLINHKRDSRTPENIFKKLKVRLTNVYTKQGTAERFKAEVINHEDFLRLRCRFDPTDSNRLLVKIDKWIKSQPPAGKKVIRLEKEISLKELDRKIESHKKISVRDDRGFSMKYRLVNYIAGLYGKRKSLPYDKESLLLNKKNFRKSFQTLFRPFPEQVDLDVKVIKKWKDKGLFYEKLYIRSERKSIMPAITVKRQNKEEKMPAVVVVPGWGQVKEEFLKQAESLARNGFLSIIPEVRGQGERAIEEAREGPFIGYTASEREISLLSGFAWAIRRCYLSQDVWDLQRLVDYLETRKDVDRDKLCIIGLCAGGFRTWLTAAMDERYKFVSPVCANSTYEAFLLQCAGHHTASLPHCFFDFPKWGDFTELALLIAPRPLIVQSSSEDTWFPLDGYTRLIETTKNIYTQLGYPDRFEHYLEIGTHDITEHHLDNFIRFCQKWS